MQEDLLMNQGEARERAKELASGAVYDDFFLIAELVREMPSGTLKTGGWPGDDQFWARPLSL